MEDMSKRNVMDIIDKILAGGDLFSVCKAIGTESGKTVAITDLAGTVFSSYQESETDMSSISLPHITGRQDHYYDADTQILYCAIRDQAVPAYIVVFDCLPHEIEQIRSLCELYTLPIRIFFSRYNAIRSMEGHLQREFIEDLLFNNITGMDEVILKSQEWGYDFSRSSYVVIYEPESSVNQQLLNHHTKAYLKLHAPHVLSSNWIGGSMVMIWPISFHSRTADADAGLSIEEANNLKQYLDQELNLRSSVGIGRAYASLKNIHLSYREARASLIIPRLMGETNFIKHFEELGVFKLLYMQDLKYLKAFCQEMLGPLLEFDRYNNGELILTLRAMFDGNMHMTKVADEQLFIHVNTLRYRIRKIEELLNKDLNNIEDQVNLFIALRLYDALVANHLLDEV